MGPRSGRKKDLQRGAWQGPQRWPHTMTVKCHLQQPCVPHCPCWSKERSIFACLVVGTPAPGEVSDPSPPTQKDHPPHATLLPREMKPLPGSPPTRATLDAPVTCQGWEPLSAHALLGGDLLAGPPPHSSATPSAWRRVLAVLVMEGGWGDSWIQMFPLGREGAISRRFF